MILKNTFHYSIFLTDDFMLKNKLLGWRKAEKKNPGVYIEHEIFKSFITQAGVHMALYYAFLQFYPFSSFQFFPLPLTF